MDKPNKYNNKNTPAKIDPSYFGKSAPQAKELEEAVLGALLVDKNVITVLVDILQEESFYDERHKVVYRAMLRLFEKGNPIDLLTVSQELRQMGSLETIGGAFYLTELANRVASAANVEYHSRIVLQKFLQRELIQLGTEVINDAFDETGDVFELLERTEQTLFKIAERNVSRGVVSLGVLLESVKEQIKNAANQKTGLSGVPTGFTALDRLTNGWQKSDLIIVAARPAMGKCLGKGTKVMLYNGELKNVEAVQVGDLLMGDDSTPRKVLSIARGREQMYWIRQIHGIDYRVNESHILSLKRSRNEGKHKNGDVLNIEIKDYLPKSQKWKSNYKGYKVGVEFEEKPCAVEPYFLGLWLGDGKSDNVRIYTQDNEVVEYLHAYADRINAKISVTDINRCPGYSVVKNSTIPQNDKCLQAKLRDLNVLSNKHIPQHYLTNSRKHRLALLAGLIDSDGHYNANYGGTYEITTKLESLAHQIKYLCDTLGFRTSLKSKKAQIKSIGYETTVWRVRFNGNVDEIPVRIPRKKANVWTNPKNWQVTGIRVEKDIVDDYYGFEIDGNHLFLLEDATVTHNTAFTLALGTFASIDCEMPVAFFSLEMSSVQLATRIVSMRANIPSEVLRTGRLSPDELLRLDAAHQAMHKMPLFIDDTAGISILELRAKCRRLKLQHDIKLVIIDYLQLMKGDSESSKSGNREQEIASISRGLKALAKELSIPVIALAQLSRAVETRGGNKRPMLSDLRECVTGDTRVLLKNGSLVCIADLVGSQPEVWAIDNTSHRLSARASDLVWKVGEKPIFKIRLASGRLIRATAEHRLLGANGWQTVEKLKQGDRLAILRKSPEPENPVFVAPERLIVLAHLIGDGSYLTGKPLRYTTASESHSDAVKAAAEQGFGVLVNRHEGRGNWHQLVFSGNGNRWHKKGINAWLNELGIWGQRSHQKQIPNLIFQLNNEQLSLFLRHLWATDGTIFTPKVGSKKSGSKIAFSTNSRTLAEDVAMLLLRFEIVARIRTVKQGAKYRDMFSVEVSGGKDQLQFLDKIGAFGSKVEKADLLKSYLANRSQNTNVDTLPNEIFERVKSLMQAQKISQRQMASLRGTSYGGGSHFQFAPSRDLVKNYAELLQADDLAAFADNDIFWDKVLSIEADGCEEVYDLTVLEHHNWVANGIISHNSGAIEQDADIVSFLYRPEYYGLTEDDDGQPVQGIAEVIVAKHRNGAVETVRLRWDAQFAKFSNLADSEFGDIDPTEYFQVSNTNPLVAPPTNMDFPTLEDEGLKFKSQPDNDIPF